MIYQVYLAKILPRIKKVWLMYLKLIWHHMKSKIWCLKYEEILKIVIQSKDSLIFEAVNALNNAGNNVVVTPKIMALDMNTCFVKMQNKMWQFWTKCTVTQAKNQIKKFNTTRNIFSSFFFHESSCYPSYLYFLSHTQETKRLTCER